MTPHLLIGLGNPGKSYAGNRHNIGFMAADAIAEACRFSAWKKSKGGLLAEGKIPLSPRERGAPKAQGEGPHPAHDARHLLPQGEGKVFLLKPQSYMNLSGGPAGEIARFYKIPVENIIAIHDELDLPLGKLRVKKGGGNGGHNGLKSLDEHLGKDYWRIRVGIGHPGDKDMVSDYVLSDFTKAERKTAETMVIEIARYIDILLAGDEAGFMNKVTLALQE